MQNTIRKSCDQSCHCQEKEIEQIIANTSDALKENFTTPSRLISYYEIYSIIDEIALKIKRRYIE